MTCSRPKALSEVDGNLAHRASERWVGDRDLVSAFYGTSDFSV